MITFIRDRFLRIVVLATVIIILGMVALHINLNRNRNLEEASRSASPVSQKAEAPSPSEGVGTLPSKGPFRVVRVLDGDTFVLKNGETVRLIGIDTPETRHPEVPVQRFGEEAKEFLKRLIEGFECTLEYEPDNIRDKYGRLLAYVFIEDLHVNAEMIRRGYAYAYTRFPFNRQNEFIALEHEARESQYGLWNISLRDGKIANLVQRYESLNLEGRKRLDEILNELVRKYPFEQKKTLDSLPGEKIE